MQDPSLPATLDADFSEWSLLVRSAVKVFEHVSQNGASVSLSELEEEPSTVIRSALFDRDEVQPRKLRGQIIDANAQVWRMVAAMEPDEVSHRAPSPVASTPMGRFTWPPPWTRSVGCSEPISFPADPDGYSALLTWLGDLRGRHQGRGGGEGSYGAGIARFLARAGVHVVEVDRQNRQARHHSGKSDPLDAVEAARAVLSGRAHGMAKSRDGSVEAIRVLVVAKRSARGARIKALTQMRQLTFSAPDQLQSRLKGLPIAAFVAAAQGLRPTRSPDAVTAATKASLSSLGHRVGDLEAEIAELDAMITPLLEETAPELLAVYGVGIDTAAALLGHRRRQPRAPPF